MMTEQIKHVAPADGSSAVTLTNPNALLTRVQLATALTAAGFPVRPGTLSAMAVNGDGPEYQTFGPSGPALYRWGAAMNWAIGRLSPPRRNASARHTGSQA